MPEYSSADIKFRKQLAVDLLSAGRTSLDDQKFVDVSLLPEDIALTAALAIPFPAGLGPKPLPLSPKPHPDDKLPKVDVVLVTWTVAEQTGMADVLTPGFSRNTWYRYSRNFETKFGPQIRRGAPSAKSGILGSYFIIKIGGKKVLCFKSELHLNQDGIRNYNGSDQTSLPVRDLFKQIIEDTQCKHIFTVGTCGGIQLNHDLGDVLVTRAARFYCKSEFQNAPYNNKTYKSDWNIPTTYFTKAEGLMQSFAQKLKEPIFGPPTKRHTGTNWTLTTPFKPNIIHEKGTGVKNKLRKFQPILTTDFFEFGQSENAATLWADGCGVEMGDAALGLACTDDITNPPKWAVIRNISDPQINADLTLSPSVLNMQAHWAVWYYLTYGYWTSVMSALTSWGVVAGL
ncbi:MAG: hypothetical protein ABI760_21365 [Ferruginibacter sp.]